MKTIILATKDDCPEPFKTLQSLAREKGWNKWNLYKKKFPFEYKGYTIEKHELK